MKSAWISKWASSKERRRRVRPWHLLLVKPANDLLAAPGTWAPGTKWQHQPPNSCTSTSKWLAACTSIWAPATKWLLHHQHQDQVSTCPNWYCFTIALMDNLLGNVFAGCCTSTSAPATKWLHQHQPAPSHNLHQLILLHHCWTICWEMSWGVKVKVGDKVIRMNNKPYWSPALLFSPTR